MQTIRKITILSLSLYILSYSNLYFCLKETIRKSRERFRKVVLSRKGTLIKIDDSDSKRVKDREIWHSLRDSSRSCGFPLGNLWEDIGKGIIKEQRKVIEIDSGCQNFQYLSVIGILGAKSIRSTWYKLILSRKDI